MRLAISLEIREWWGTRHLTKPRNAMYFRNRMADGKMIGVGFMMPMSPPRHP